MHSIKPLCFSLHGLLLLVALVRSGGEGLLVDSAQVALVIALCWRCPLVWHGRHRKALAAFACA
jgi:hypothetical protein